MEEGSGRRHAWPPQPLPARLAVRVPYPAVTLRPTARAAPRHPLPSEGKLVGQAAARGAVKMKGRQATRGFTCAVLASHMHGDWPLLFRTPVSHCGSPQELWQGCRQRAGPSPRQLPAGLPGGLGTRPTEIHVCDFKQDF